MQFIAMISRQWWRCSTRGGILMGDTNGRHFGRTRGRAKVYLGHRHERAAEGLALRAGYGRVRCCHGIDPEGADGEILGVLAITGWARRAAQDADGLVPANGGSMGRRAGPDAPGFVGAGRSFASAMCRREGDLPQSQGVGTNLAWALAAHNGTRPTPIGPGCWPIFQRLERLAGADGAALSGAKQQFAGAGRLPGVRSPT